MPTFTDLNELLENKLANTARFVRMAFHIHSPDSHDWGHRAMLTAQKTAMPDFGREKARSQSTDDHAEACDKGRDEFLDELADHFDIVCITDHMKVSFACSLATAAAKREDITIFPGMEVNCILPIGASQRIHLLVFFPPEKRIDEIERIFAHHPNFPSETNRNGSEDFRIDGSLADWIQIITAQGGMLVVAHVDDASRGHRAHFRALRRETLGFFVTNRDGIQIADREIGDEYKDHIATCGVHAIEIMNPEDRQHYVAFGSERRQTQALPCVIRSDAHCVEDFADRKKKDLGQGFSPDL